MLDMPETMTKLIDVGAVLQARAIIKALSGGACAVFDLVSSYPCE